jgi:hypothetical protein
MTCNVLAIPLGVIAGLDPAIHLAARQCLVAKWMDARVEPAHDGLFAWSVLSV